MKKIAAGVIVLAAVVGLLYWKFPKKFPTHLPASIKLPEISSPSGKLSTQSGKVAGVSVQMQQAGGELLEKGIEVGKSVSTIFLSSPDQKKQSIEVQKVVEQVQKQIEAIPSNVLEQAKIQYCTAVLQQATVSASSQ